MNSKRDFLENLFKNLHCRLEILNFLESQKLITSIESQKILNQNHQTHAIQILNLLNKLKDEGELQLVDFEWTLLPQLKMRLFIVGKSDSKEWIFNR